MALASPTGRWLKVNRARCKLVGYTEAELLELSFQDITYPGDLAGSLERERQLMAGEISSYQIEKRYNHADGHLVTVLLDVSLARDSKHQPRCLIAQIHDISERKLTEQSLRPLSSAVKQSNESIMITEADLDPPRRQIPHPPHPRPHRQSNERRPRKMPRCRRERLHRQACEYRPKAVADARVAVPLKTSPNRQNS